MQSPEAKSKLWIIYPAIVCAMCMLVVLFSGSVFLYNIIKVSFPSYTISSYEYRKFRDNEVFLDWKEEHIKDEKVLPKKYQNLSPQEVTEKRLHEEAAVLADERRDAVGAMLVNLPIILLSLLLFGLHWRLYRRTFSKD